MFILTQSPIDIDQLRKSRQDLNDGAFITFEGIVRADSHDQSHVNGLLYHADSEACVLEGEKIIAEALSQYAINHVSCTQRIGRLNAGDTAIWIGVWAGHRDGAYQASRYIIEEIKKRLLIWKKEFHEDGTSKWVHGQATITL